MKSPKLEAMIEQVEHEAFNCLNCGKHISEHQQTFNVIHNEIAWVCVQKIGGVAISTLNDKPVEGQMFIVTGKYEKAEP